VNQLIGVNKWIDSLKMENKSLKIDVEIAKSEFVDQVVVFNKWIESLKMGNKLL
jgi:hypothetical protein